MASEQSRATLRQVVRYRFDTFMARGGVSIFLSLLILFLGSVSLVALLRGLFLWLDPGGASQFDGFLRHVYIGFLQLTDPGNMNLEIPSSGLYKVSAVVAGMIGVIILSMLIAFITTGLDQKLHELKKGHSKVIEEDHTLILGWSERVVEILRELILANESEDDPCVVILSPRDKEWMDDHLALHLGDAKNTRIVTRSGSVSSLVNLDIASVNTAKSVICVADCTDAAATENKIQSDTQMIKTILGIMASKGPDQELNVVAELFDPFKRELAEEVSPEVVTIDALEILAKILVQTSRSIGLSVVYNEVMSFDGCELYFYNATWGDVPFGQLQYHFGDGVPLGIRRESGDLSLNPPLDTRLDPGDDILILAEDDSTIAFESGPVIAPRDIPIVDRRAAQKVEHELILGWSPKAPILVCEYADYVLDGSTITVMMKDPSEAVRQQIRELQASLDGLELRLIDLDPLDRAILIEAQPFLYDNIIVLSQSGEDASAETVDSQTIILLLLLRTIAAELPELPKATKLISEVMVSENQDLVARAGVNDFIISNKLVSMLLAQISEEADIKRVYDDLFEEDGSEIYLKPARLYLDHLPARLTFADCMGLAQKRGEVCLGVKIKSLEKDAASNYGVKLIPEKNTVYDLQADDALVVLSEDET